MKKNLLKPGFEFTFALGVIMSLLLPPLVMAQQRKEFKVTIVNNDTTINGKNIKDMSVADRQKALKELKGINDTGMVRGAAKRYRIITKNGPDGNGLTMLTEDYNSEGRPMKRFRIDMDTSVHNMKNYRLFTESEPNKEVPREGNVRFKVRDNSVGDNSVGDNIEAFAGNSHREPRMNDGRRNNQTFNYANTDKDGISTRVNFNIGDANRETAKRITGAEKAELEIGDLLITQSFTTGKTTLSFTLPTKASAEIQFKDSDGKVLWSDKATSAFSKGFILPQNGIYYLQVKQGSKVGLRRIVKEQ